MAKTLELKTTLGVMNISTNRTTLVCYFDSCRKIKAIERHNFSAFSDIFYYFGGLRFDANQFDSLIVQVIIFCKVKISDSGFTSWFVFRVNWS